MVIKAWDGTEYEESDLEHLGEEERNALLVKPVDTDEEALKELAGEGDGDGDDDGDDDGGDGDGDEDGDGDGQGDGEGEGEGDGDGDEGEGDGEGGEGGEGAGEGDGAGDGAEGQGDGDGDEGAEVDDPPARATLKIEAKPVENYDGQMAALETREEKLAQQLDNGDVTLSEYHKELRKITDLRTDLKLQQSRYEQAEELNKQAAKSDWDTDCANFLAQNKWYSGNQVRLNSLNAEVVRLANDPKNASWSGTKVLREADKSVRAAFGVKPRAEAEPDAGKGKNNAADDKNGKKGKGSKMKLPTTPNMARVPAAEGENPAAGDEFANIDKLDGMALQEALERMTPAQQERYLARS